MFACLLTFNGLRCIVIVDHGMDDDREFTIRYRVDELRKILKYKMARDVFFGM